MRYGPAWELQRRYHSCGLWRRQAAPDGDRAEAGEIDAVEIGEKAVNEVDAGLLAVADDVDPRVLLPLHREDSRVDLASGERVALEPPCGLQLFRLGEPERLRQVVGDGGCEHVGSREGHPRRTA